MSVTDALTITSAPDALTRYYNAKECEESAVRYIEDAYIESVNSLEKLEAENAKLMELCVQMVETVECSSSTRRCALFSECEAGEFEPCLYEQKLREMGIEVPE